MTPPCQGINVYELFQVLALSSTTFCIGAIVGICLERLTRRRRR